MEIKGEIFRVSGPVVTAEGISPRMYDVVLVGHEKLMGEVIGLEGDKSTIQVYEDTSGIMPGEPVENTVPDSKNFCGYVSCIFFDRFSNSPGRIESLSIVCS